MSLDPDGVADSIRQELFERWMAFLEFEHPSLSPEFPGGVIALVLNTEEITCDFGDGARTYQPAPFRPSLLASEADLPPIARIDIVAFDDAIRAARSVTAHPEARLFVALESDLGLVPVPKQREASGFAFAITYDAFRIEVPVTPETIEDEAQSRYQFTPHNNPPLFGVSS